MVLNSSAGVRSASCFTATSDFFLPILPRTPLLGSTAEAICESPTELAAVELPAAKPSVQGSWHRVAGASCDSIGISLVGLHAGFKNPISSLFCRSLLGGPEENKFGGLDKNARVPPTSTTYPSFRLV